MIFMVRMLYTTEALSHMWFDCNRICSLDPGEFAQQRHRLGRDNKFKVELVQDNVEQTSSKTRDKVTLTPSKTIEITVVSGSDVGADMIQYYLEGPTSGGGDKEVEVMTRVSNGVYRAKLSSIEGTYTHMYLYVSFIVQLLATIVCIKVKHSLFHFFLVSRSTDNCQQETPCIYRDRTEDRLCTRFPSFISWS